MKDKIIEIVSKAVKIDPVVLMENSSVRIWDSLSHLEIILLLEESFDIRFNDKDIVEMQSINAIFDVISRIENNK